MQVFDVRVRLSGEVGQEVPRARVSASEITLLRAIHGDDAVIPVSYKGDVARNKNDEFQVTHSSGEPWKRVPKTGRNVGDKEHYAYLLARYEKFPSALATIDHLFGSKLNPQMVMEVDESSFHEMAGAPGSDDDSAEGVLD